MYTAVYQNESTIENQKPYKLEKILESKNGTVRRHWISDKFSVCPPPLFLPAQFCMIEMKFLLVEINIRRCPREECIVHVPTEQMK